MARRAATAPEARKPVAKRKDWVRAELDAALWAAVEQWQDPLLQAEGKRQIQRIYKMWGWLGE